MKNQDKDGKKNLSEVESRMEDKIKNNKEKTNAEERIKVAIKMITEYNFHVALQHTK